MAGAVLNNENLVTNAPHWPKIIGNNLKIHKFILSLVSIILVFLNNFISLLLGDDLAK